MGPRHQSECFTKVHEFQVDMVMKTPRLLDDSIVESRDFRVLIIDKTKQVIGYHTDSHRHTDAHSFVHVCVCVCAQLVFFGVYIYICIYIYMHIYIEVKIQLPLDDASKLARVKCRLRKLGGVKTKKKKKSMRKTATSRASSASIAPRWEVYHPGKKLGIDIQRLI